MSALKSSGSVLNCWWKMYLCRQYTQNATKEQIKQSWEEHRKNLEVKLERRLKREYNDSFIP